MRSTSPSQAWLEIPPQPLPAAQRKPALSGEDTERGRGKVLHQPALPGDIAAAQPAQAATAAVGEGDGANTASDAGGSAAGVPAAPPRGVVARFVSASISSLILSVVYIPFTMAILLQSALTGQPVLPINWEKELTGRSWLLSFSLFAFMVAMPPVMLFAVLTDSGLWSLQSNAATSSIPFTLCLALFLSLLTALHLCTIYYAHMRQDLREIHSAVHQFHLSPSALLTTASIVFESFQLISPWLTVQSLGLDNSTGDGDDDFRGWLHSAGEVFGIGSWQVQGLNSYLATFWTAFSIVMLYAFALGYGIQSNMQPSHRVAPVLFELIPGTLYLSIVGRLFSILNCLPTEGGGYVLQGNASIECWDNSGHRLMCLAALLALLCYSSSAMFVACYRGDAAMSSTSVKFKPRYLVIERTCRDLYAITTSLIRDGELSRCLSFPVLLLLLSCTVGMQPCSIPALSRLKMLSQGSAVWLLFISFTADVARVYAGSYYDAVFPGVLVSGWGALAACYVAFELWNRRQRKRRLRARRSSIATLSQCVMQGLPVPALPPPSEEDDVDEETETMVQRLSARASLSAPVQPLQPPSTQATASSHSVSSPAPAIPVGR